MRNPSIFNIPGAAGTLIVKLIKTLKRSRSVVILKRRRSQSISVKLGLTKLKRVILRRRRLSGLMSRKLTSLELSFKPGSIITKVWPSESRGWFVGTLEGKRGHVPANYVVILHDYK